MNRYSSSLLGAIGLHLVLLAALFAAYSYFLEPKETLPKKQKNYTAINLKNCTFEVPHKEVVQKISKKPANHSTASHKRPKPGKKVSHKKKVKKCKTHTKKKKIIKKKRVVQKQIRPEKKESKELKEPKKAQAETPKKKQSSLHVKAKNTPPLDVNKQINPKETTIKTNKMPQPSYRETYCRLNLEKIVSAIKENLYYPRKARKRGIEGKVLIRFTLQKDGSVSDIAVLESDYPILSRAARRTILEIEGEVEAPKESITLTLPVLYSLQ